MTSSARPGEQSRASRPAAERSARDTAANDPTAPSRYAFEYSDQDVELSQDQTVLIDDLLDNTRAPAVDFAVVNDEEAGIYEAVVDDRTIAGLSYDVVDGDRLVLLAISVFPDFREQGVATELIRRVLDDVRARGRTVTVMCPIVRTFVENNRGYAGLVDPQHPGVTRR